MADDELVVVGWLREVLLARGVSVPSSGYLVCGDFEFEVRLLDGGWVLLVCYRYVGDDLGVFDSDVVFEVRLLLGDPGFGDGLDGFVGRFLVEVGGG